MSTDPDLAGLDQSSKATASFALAAKAREIRKANPGMDAQTAIVRALPEIKQQITTEPKTMFGIKYGTKETYDPTQNAAPKGGTYSSAADVKSAYQAGKLSKDEATKLLRDQFGYQ